MNTKTLAALLAATALTSVSAFANPVKFTGDLYVGAGSNRSDDSGLENADPMLLGGRVAAYIPFNNTKLSVTPEFFAEHGWDLTNSSEFPDGSNWGGALHFNYAQANRYVLGLVGGAFELQQAGTELASDEDRDDTEWYWLFGAEGKYLLERAAIWAQAGYMDTFNRRGNSSADEDNEFFQKISFVRMGVNYYLEDDLKISGEFGAYDGINFDFDGFEDFSTRTETSLYLYRVELEQQIGSMWSIYGAYQYADMNGETNTDYMDQNAFFFGVRARFGADDGAALIKHEATNSIGTPQIGQFLSVNDELE